MAYKYLNIDEVTIFTDNIRCSEGLKATSHVSHKFGNNDGTYCIETSVVLHSIKDADKFNNVQYNFILGDGNRISTSLGDAIGAIDALATISSLFAGGNYSSFKQQKIDYIVGNSHFSDMEYEAIQQYGIKDFEIKFGQNLSKTAEFKYQKDFPEKSKEIVGCILEYYKKKENIKESKYYKPMTPKIGEITDPTLVQAEINNLVQQKLSDKYKLNEDFSFDGIIDKKGNLTKVKLKSDKLDKKIIKVLENLIENIKYGLSPATNKENKPIEQSYKSVNGF